MSSMASDRVEDNVIYSPGQRHAVIILILAGALTICSVVGGCIYYCSSRRTKTYHKTHVAPYLICLLLSNVLQAIATIMNARWVEKGEVYNGGFCSVQGGLKNAANVGTALWNLILAFHVFNLLFLRWKNTRASLIATLTGGWSFILMIVTLGPSVIEKPGRRPYFGVSGTWCWITAAYPSEQIYMEYFIEFLSAGLCFVLYCLVLLRVRGNLRTIEGRWKLCWIRRSEAWQLSFARDMLDSAMLRVAASMVWFPVAYSLTIVPVGLARLSSFAGHSVPFWAIVATDFIFNITGLVNTILFIVTRRLLPDTASLPRFTTPRNSSMSESEAKFGVTPFAVKSSTNNTSGTHEHEESEKIEAAPPYTAVGLNEYLDAPVQPRQDAYTVTLSEGVIMPTLEFSYPSQSPKAR